MPRFQVVTKRHGTFTVEDDVVPRVGDVLSVFDWDGESMEVVAVEAVVHEYRMQVGLDGQWTDCANRRETVVFLGEGR